MSTITEPDLVTPAEYLVLEGEAEDRHELLDGVITPMPGTSEGHTVIAGNLYAEIWSHLRDLPIKIYARDMRVRIGDSYVYPDVVFCVESPRFEDGPLKTLLNPAVVIEVLSPSTEGVDRGRKAVGYRGLESVTDYLLIGQDRIVVEHWTRGETGWSAVERTRPDDLIELPSIGLALPLRRVYAKVSLPGDLA